MLNLPPTITLPYLPFVVIVLLLPPPIKWNCAKGSPVEMTLLNPPTITEQQLQVMVLNIPPPINEWQVLLLLHCPPTTTLATPTLEFVLPPKIEA